MTGQQTTDIAGQSTTWLWDITSAHYPPDKVEEQVRKAMNVLQEFIAIEATWTDVEPEGDEWAYRPYPLGKFGRLLTRAVLEWDRTHSIRPELLEVGCGPGTKVIFAQEFMGVDATGFDVRIKYIEAARELGLSRDLDPEVFLADAEKFHEWGDFNIVFLNRPFRDLDREAKLDQVIYDAMEPGSFLLLGNAVTQPPGWKMIDQDVACGLWQKTCRCEGIEEIIAADVEGPPEFFFEAVCRQCGRSLSLRTLASFAHQ